MIVKPLGYKELKKYGKSYVVKMSMEGNIPWDCCSCCGKPLTKNFYSVIPSDGYEYLFGAGCYRKLTAKK